MHFLKKIALFFINTKKFGSTLNATGRLSMRNFFQMIFLSECNKRKRLISEIATPQPPLRIPEDSAYVDLTNVFPGLIKDAIEEARQIITNTDLVEAEKKAPRPFLVTIPVQPQNIARNAIFKMALDHAVLKIIGEYIGMLPVIEGVWIWYSPNRNNEDGSSQNYHLDGQDIRTVQVLIAIEDTDINNGPFTFVEATESEKLATVLDYRPYSRKAATGKNLKRISDTLVQQQVPADKVHQLLGPAGTAYAVDTDRCLHFGSRKANKPRFTLVIQYYSPFAFALPWRWWRALPYSKVSVPQTIDQYQRLALGKLK